MKKERNDMSDTNPLYVIQKTENQLLKSVEAQLVNKNQTPNIIEAPLSTGFDYGINLTNLASSEGLSPQDLALQIANSMDGAEAVGPFLNFRIDMSKFGHAVIDQILDMKSDYGKENEGNGQRVVIDIALSKQNVRFCSYNFWS